MWIEGGVEGGWIREVWWEGWNEGWWEVWIEGGVDGR